MEKKIIKYTTFEKNFVSLHFIHILFKNIFNNNKLFLVFFPKYFFQNRKEENFPNNNFDNSVHKYTAYQHYHNYIPTEE